MGGRELHGIFKAVTSLESFHVEGLYKAQRDGSTGVMLSHRLLRVYGFLNGFTHIRSNRFWLFGLSGLHRNRPGEESL